MMMHFFNIQNKIIYNTYTQLFRLLPLNSIACKMVNLIYMSGRSLGIFTQNKNKSMNMAEVDMHTKKRENIII